jgi:hypothetical protein
MNVAATISKEPIAVALKDPANIVDEGKLATHPVEIVVAKQQQNGSE